MPEMTRPKVNKKADIITGMKFFVLAGLANIARDKPKNPYVQRLESNSETSVRSVPYEGSRTLLSATADMTEAVKTPMLQKVQTEARLRRLNLPSPQIPWPEVHPF
eukprot:CAMPEP_0118665884 /NCGR_PEP_ID=MMETSP0785-20121206/18885_1 /TAXON_ID=91992 /ORGANISM="Bolidomonas pacifica, Strain CCMP 1866" /LENGTH=105 /DNA_ID=CAMNT_0006560089 /DNA_START=676 /DNA_END=990 /DNA_ORIENTATION=+